MAPTWPQYWPSHLLFHYFSIVLDILFSENSNHFRILKAKIWYKWSEHGVNLGLILPHYAQNVLHYLVLICLKCMPYQQIIKQFIQEQRYGNTGEGGVVPHTYVFSAICQRNCFNLDIDIDIDIDILKKKKMSIGEKWQKLATAKNNRYYSYTL